MNYADSQFVKLALSGAGAMKPQFSELVTVDYYDGIETGFGCYANGEIVKINSLADSNSRLFRAFEFVVVDGNWIEKVSRLSSESYEYAKQLLGEMSLAVPVACFVGVATLNLDWIKLVEISADALPALRNERRSEKEIYLEVHRLTKGRQLRLMPKHQRQ